MKSIVGPTRAVFGNGVHTLIRIGVLVGILFVIISTFSKIYWPNLLPSPQWQPRSALWEGIGLALYGLDIFVTTMNAVLFPAWGLIAIFNRDGESRRDHICDWLWMIAFYAVLAFGIWIVPMRPGYWPWRPIP